MLGFIRNRRGPAPARPKRALLAWEFGAGRTHILNLLGVAAHLRSAGFECLAALCEPGFQREFAALGIPVVQNFLWPTRRRSLTPWTRRPSRSPGDHLANSGMVYPPAVEAAVGHYDGLFALFPADVVVADCAFGSLLAARDRCPVVAIGSASNIPPVFGTGFPPYFAGSAPPSWPEDEVCAAINRGLALAGRFPLDSYAEVLRFDRVYPFGPAAFDPFAAYRPAPALAPYLPNYREPGGSAPHDEVFVYLHGLVQRRGEVLAALPRIGRPLRAYIPDLSEEHRAELSASGILLEEQPVPLPDILARSRCVVHHGGGQLTTACLAAGLPQVILTKQLDNEIVGGWVESRGLGAAARVGAAPAEWIVGEIRRAYDDEAWTAHCRGEAAEFRAWLREDPTRVAAEGICALLGVSAPA